MNSYTVKGVFEGATVGYINKKSKEESYKNIAGGEFFKEVNDFYRQIERIGETIVTDKTTKRNGSLNIKVARLCSIRKG